MSQTKEGLNREVGDLQWRVEILSEDFLENKIQDANAPAQALTPCCMWYPHATVISFSIGTVHGAAAMRLPFRTWKVRSSQPPTPTFSVWASKRWGSGSPPLRAPNKESWIYDFLWPEQVIPVQISIFYFMDVLSIILKVLGAWRSIPGVVGLFYVPSASGRRHDSQQTLQWVSGAIQKTEPSREATFSIIFTKIIPKIDLPYLPLFLW